MALPFKPINYPTNLSSEIHGYDGAANFTGINHSTKHRPVAFRPPIPRGLAFSNCFFCQPYATITETIACENFLQESHLDHLLI